MLGIFLVEDEIVVREGIRENFPWEKNDFSLVGEASDGEMALLHIEELHPDIVITDIRMPSMNGLELAAILKKNMPWVKVIIVSGHDEFSYAQEAIGIGVTDYVLKPVSSEELLVSLNKAAGEIHQDSVRRTDIETMRRTSFLYSDIEKERFIGDLAAGVFNPSAAIAKSKEIGVDVIARFYCVALVFIRMENFGASTDEAFRIESIVNELVENNESVFKYRFCATELGLVFSGKNEEEVRASGFMISRAIKAEVEKHTACDIHVSLGSVRERVGGIHESMNDARIASGFSHIFGSDSIIGIDDAKLIRGGKSLLVDSGTKEIEQFLKTGNPSQIDETIEKTLDRMRISNGQTIFYAISFVQILGAVSMFLDELGGNPEEILPDLDQLINIISRERVQIESCRTFLHKALFAALEFREERKNCRYGDLILKAREYINTNYIRGNLSLADVANEVNISPGHFSAVFSQETGRTFIEQLTELRIAKACELLKTTSLKSSEIAYQVGYNDPHYFSHIFKKQTGMTSKQYRKKV